MRHTRHARGFGGSREGRVIFGLVVVGWGLLMLFDTLGIAEFRGMLRVYWPALIVVWGVTRIAFGRRGGRGVGLIAIAVGGFLLGNRLLGWNINPVVLWPLLVIVVGLRIMFHSRHERWHHSVRVEVSGTGIGGGTGGATVIPGESRVVDDGAEPSATLQEFALLGSVDRKNTSQTFRGGDLTAVLGSVAIDLRECRMADAEALLDVFAFMGGIELRIPRDWAVESRVSAILGGFDDKSTPPVDGSAKRLVIAGQAVMGGIEIKN